MTIEYHHSFLYLNGRKINLSQLPEHKGNADTEFEADTLSFIHQWLGGQNEFECQTSGSTGTPKKILITRSQMETSARLTLETLGIGVGGTAWVCLPTRFIGGKMMLVRALVNKMQIHCSEPTTLPVFHTGTTITLSAMVPLQADALLAQGSADILNRIENLLIGGAPLSTSLEERLAAEVSGNVYSTYGMTETISHIALRKLKPGGEGYFQTLRSIFIRTNQNGCLCIKAPWLPDEVITNDMVRLITTDTFEWLGRADHVINSGGLKLSPEALEKELEALFPWGCRIMIAGLPDARLGQKVTLLLEGRRLSDTEQSEIMDLITKKIDRPERPRQIFTLDSFSSTHSGKLDRLLTLKRAQIELKLT